MSQLSLFSSNSRPQPLRSSPYQPFDADSARRIILDRLQRAAGAWVRRRELCRATGMRPAFISSLLAQLVAAGTIERTYTLPIIHTMHGNMGQTTGYRMAQPAQVAA